MSEVENLVENFSLGRLSDFRMLFRDRIDFLLRKKPENVGQIKRLNWRKSIVDLAIAIKRAIE